MEKRYQGDETKNDRRLLLVFKQNKPDLQNLRKSKKQKLLP